jgi:hypothetical protein
MIYSKTNPAGIDYCISVIQSFLYTEIQRIWSLSEAEILSYPRVERIRKREIDDKERLAYFSDGKYTQDDMLLDDRYSVLFCFYPINRPEYMNYLNYQDVEILFFVNLSKLKPSITHRGDEEVRSDIRSILPRPEAYKGTYDLIELPGFTEVMDMQPFHSFKILTTQTYD